MWLIADLRQLFEHEPWKNRIAYAVLLLLAALYLLVQIGMAIAWLATGAMLDNL